MHSNIHAATLYASIKPTNRLLEIPLLLAFNLLLVACAQVAINLPYVPITGQTFGVLLIAMTLGRARGTAVVMAYLLEGALGLPVFAEGAAGAGVLLGTTGGYLIGFPLAAYVVGWLADRRWGTRYLKSATAMTVGTVIIFVCGVTWLSRFVPSGSLLQFGVTPFIPGAIIKIVIAAMLLPSIFKMVRPKH